MRIRRRSCLFAFFVVATAIAFPTLRAARAADESDKQDMLCGNAPRDTVQPVPALLADWVVVLCTPSGQALAPEIPR